MWKVLTPVLVIALVGCDRSNRANEGPNSPTTPSGSPATQPALRTGATALEANAPTHGLTTTRPAGSPSSEPNGLRRDANTPTSRPNPALRDPNMTPERMNPRDANLTPPRDANASSMRDTNQPRSNPNPPLRDPNMTPERMDPRDPNAPAGRAGNSTSGHEPNITPWRVNPRAANTTPIASDTPTRDANTPTLDPNGPPRDANGPPPRDPNTPGRANPRDANAAPQGPGDSSASASAAAFLRDAASGGLMEVELGRLAAERAADPQVKAFGGRMVTDHTQANQELKQTAERVGVSIPARPNPEHQAHLDRLAKLNGADFDRQYMTFMATEHEQDVSQFEALARDRSDPGVQSFAEKTLPTLRRHLQSAREILQRLGSPTASAPAAR